MKHIKKYKQFEALLRQSSLEQLKKVRSVSKGIDVDDKVNKNSEDYPNRWFHRNPIDTGIQTYKQYLSEPFSVNQNVRSNAPKKQEPTTKLVAESDCSIKKGDKVKVKMCMYKGEPTYEVEAQTDSQKSNNEESFSYKTSGDMMMIAKWNGKEWVTN